MHTIKKCIQLWCEARLKVKVSKHVGLGPLLEVEMWKKVHTAVARSKFGSENAQNTWGMDCFWTSRCRPVVQTVHTMVALSTCRSQRCKKLRVLSNFLMIWWWFDVNNYNYNYNCNILQIQIQIQIQQQQQQQQQPLQLHYTRLHRTALQLPLPLQLQPATSTFQLQLQLQWTASNCLSVHRFIRSVIHHSQQPTSYRFPVFETSTTILCGTYWYMYI